MDQSAHSADGHESARVTLMNVPRDDEHISWAFEEIGAAGSSVEMVWMEDSADTAQNSGSVDISFLLSSADLHRVLGSLRRPPKRSPCSRIRVDRQVTRIDLRLPGRAATGSLLARMRSTGCCLKHVSLVSRPDGNAVLLVPHEGYEEVEHAAIVEQGRHARNDNSASDPEEWV